MDVFVLWNKMGKKMFQIVCKNAQKFGTWVFVFPPPPKKKKKRKKKALKVSDSDISSREIV